MNKKNTSKKNNLPTGVMFNAYPDSIGRNLADIISMLKKSEFKDVFSLFYILPTFFNSDLDRGFSVIDYDINKDLVSPNDVKELAKLKIGLKFDLVLNHLSVGSIQFQDMLKHGDKSKFKDFFINWDEFWKSNGEMGKDGYIIPKEEYLQKLFMRKPGLPILKVRFPDSSDRPYWNTFYQEVTYQEIAPEDLSDIDGLTSTQTKTIANTCNKIIKKKGDLNEIDLQDLSHYKEKVISIIEMKRTYLGQMDLNANSEKVWDFYDETLKKLRSYGGSLIRLDAFAYLHKKPGEINFFNKPGTWDYLERLKKMAKKHQLILLPEIHSEYGHGLHEEVANEGFPIYDFFFPGLVIDALDSGSGKYLLSWIKEMIQKNILTVNMLGCHDGIPVLDLKSKEVDGVRRPGLLSDERLDENIDRILKRGGRVKNLYGPDGTKISYYQVNATFFSALGEDENKLLLARAIQMFIPGIPQIWYLDLFAGKNDYAAADKGGTAGHKEINRTTLSLKDIEKGLKKKIVKDQLKLMKFRNTFPAFLGSLDIKDSDDNLICLTWIKGKYVAKLNADLSKHTFDILYTDEKGKEKSMSF